MAATAAKIQNPSLDPKPFHTDLGHQFGWCRFKNVTGFGRKPEVVSFCPKVGILRPAEAAGGHVQPLRASENPQGPAVETVESGLEGGEGPNLHV